MKRGYKPQNYTQTPNELFDSQMAEMSEAELRVTLAVIRLSFGYHRDRFRYSLSKMCAMTGLSVNGVKAGIKAGKERGTIEYVRDDGGVGQWKCAIEGYQPVIEGVSASDTVLDETISASDTPSIKEKNKETRYHTRIQSAVEKFYMADTTLTTAIETHLGLTIRAKNKTHGEVMEFLHKVEATPADLQHFSNYWRGVDWRGKQGQAPPPTCIIELWHAAKQWTNGNGAKKKIIVT